MSQQRGFAVDAAHKAELASADAVKSEQQAQRNCMSTAWR